ncbi:MAG: TIGR03067 domain-containing protein [Bacteroidetes bacterium]|nr:TIGR03067 domain-containing protein [Bacteroidota bacterium]MBS1935435.1 TIGR03067 domain-containing protein [Bacteroidota bacterium]
MSINGKWKIEEAELGGKQLSASVFANMILELDETSYQLRENEVIDSGLIEMIGNREPQALLITGIFGPNKGKTFSCIYRLESNDDLLMCYNLGGGDFPKSFKTFENTLLYLVHYKKI